MAEHDTSAVALNPAGFGINLIGYASGDNSYGIVTRALATALQRQNVPVSIFSLPHAQSMDVSGTNVAPLFARDPSAICHPINLYNVFPDFKDILKSSPWLLPPGRLHILLLWWETTVLPAQWIGHLSRLDAIMAGSPFIRNNVANNLPLTPVLPLKIPVELPAAVRPDRKRFGVPDDATVFVTSFNAVSDPERKNPLASVHAFRRAFSGGSENARLLVRVHHGNDTDVGRLCVQVLTNAAGGDARIRILVEPMGYADILTLYASSDVFVSLHRAEGLGMGLMETMALGKPVIATGWSGNLTFMDETCGCLVRYTLREPEGIVFFNKKNYFGPNGVWAEPLVEDGAAWMQKLHADPALRQRLGTAAKTRVEQYQLEAWGRGWIDQLIAFWRTQAVLPKLKDKYSNGAAVTD